MVEKNIIDVTEEEFNKWWEEYPRKKWVKYIDFCTPFMNRYYDEEYAAKLNERFGEPAWVRAQIGEWNEGWNEPDTWSILTNPVEYFEYLLTLDEIPDFRGDGKNET